MKSFREENMDNQLIHIIKAQTDILFANAEETLKSIEDPQLNNKTICDWTLGEQIYHMLHSLDQWFINPNQYEETPYAKREK